MGLLMGVTGILGRLTKSKDHSSALTLELSQIPKPQTPPGQHRANIDQLQPNSKHPESCNVAMVELYSPFLTSEDRLDPKP